MTDTPVSWLYTVEQKRAQKASELAKADKEYKSAADRFPAMVMSSGLLQALTFYRTKKLLPYDHLATWLREAFGLPAGDDLLSYVMNLPVSEYRAATIEALAFLTWLKRFADAKHQEADRRQRRGETGREDTEESDEA